MVNFRTLDLNLLRVFEALARTGNTTRAGEELGLSQPAVSAALARLRDHLGDPLFVRAGNGMVPTDRAEALKPGICGALEKLEASLTEATSFDPATASDTFSLMGADFFSTRLMPSLSAEMMSAAPGITLRFLDSARGNLVTLLENGEIDVALEQPTKVPAWVSAALLFPSPFRVIASQRHPRVAAAGLASGDSIPLDLFCEIPHALRSTDGSTSGMTDRALEAAGRKRRVALVLPHFDAIISAVAHGGLISVIPAQLSAAAEALGLVVLDAPVAIPTPKIRLYWHSRHDKAPAQRWLRGQIQSEIARIWGRDSEFD